MACGHLLGAKQPLCMAVQGLMTPALGEQRAYCLTDQPTGCPLYQRYAATREKVSLEAAVRLLAGDAVRRAVQRESTLPRQNHRMSTWF